MSKILEYTGSDDNRLVASLYGGRGEPILLVHGGGQTRHSWEETAERLAQSGYRAIALDQRGHGDSAWIDHKDYSYHAFGLDLRRVAQDIAREFGVKPILVGASLGGLSGLLASSSGSDEPFSALILVDITPKPNPKGVTRVLDFMGANLEHGFASLEEAGDAVAAYMRTRKRPDDLSGLSKNLRKSDDGRLRWHWDPAFMKARLSSTGDEEKLTEAARGISVPVLLVYGGASDLVGRDEVRAFSDLVPHARFVDVADAGHMVAGDKNTVFADAVIDFVTGLSWGL